MAAETKKDMKIGTRSLLFGVHAIWIHPFVVALAWRDWYGCWPKGLAEWIAIFCHDLGYFSCPNMDGPEGKRHPARSAAFVWNLSFLSYEVREEAVRLILGHSRDYATVVIRCPVSELCAPDKLSILFDPPWLYLLRATLSGEVWEYMRNAPSVEAQTPERWLYWLRDSVRMEFDLD